MAVATLWTLLVIVVINNAAAELSLLRHEKIVHCISSGDSTSSALAWIFPLDSSKQTASSGWKSSPSPRELDVLKCDLSKGDCGGWKKDDKLEEISSLEVYVDPGPVLDHRWEDFPLYKTDGSYTYHNKIAISGPEVNTTRTLHVSILAEKDAYLILSGGENPHTSPVYWFVIDGWRDNQITAIRRCPTGVPAEGWPNPPCSNKTAEHNGAVLKGGASWVHLTVRLRRLDDKSLNIKLEEGGRSLLDWTDTEEPFDVKFISCRTQKVLGYWRLHQYKLLRGSSGQLWVYPVRFSSPQPLCLSVIYFLSEGQGNLRVFNQTTWESSVRLTTGEGWRTARLEMDLSPNVNYTVEIFFPRERNFYLGDVRVCSKEEVHVSSLTTEDHKKTKCVELKSKHSITYKDNDDTAVSFNCPGRNFGPSCELTCGMFLGDVTPNCNVSNDCNCNGVTVCTNNRVCSCLAGYTGTDCKKTCVHRHGPNCLLDCRHTCPRHRDCNPETGECRGECREETRKRPSCDVRLPVTLQAPVLVKASSNSLQVKVPLSIDFDPSLNVTDFKLQYKEISQHQWTTSHTFSWPPRDLPLILTDLKVKTTYQVRVVLVLEDGQSFEGGEVPVLTETTLCRPVHESEISDVAIQRSISVEWTTSNEEICTELADYKIEVDGHLYNVDKLPVIITNLEYYTNYTVKVFHKNVNVAEKIVTTAEGPPAGRVQNLTVKLDGGNAKVTWTTPNKPNGVVRRYVVKYQHIKWEACDGDSISDKNSTDTMEVTSTEAVIDLSKLLPFSTYHVTVSAFTVAYGPDETTSFVTQQARALGAAPRDVTAREVSPGDVELTWREPKCDEVGCAVTTYSVRTNGTDSGHTRERNITIKGLQAFTPYEFTVNAVCGETRGRNVEPGHPTSLIYTTNPQPPPAVTDLQSYDQGKTWLSVRWSPPSPPRGELESYVVNSTNVIWSPGWGGTVGPIAACPDMRTMTCCTITSLQPFTTYNFKIAARNYGTIIGTYTQINVTTKQGAPGKVEELKIESLRDGTKVSWSQPIHRRGVITKYTVSYQHAAWKACNKIFGFDNKSIGSIEVKPKYGTTNVEAVISFSNLVPFSMYHVTVRAFTVEDGEEETMTFDTPPGPPGASPTNTTFRESADGVAVTWSKPPCDKIGCVVTSYRVLVDNVEKGTTTGQSRSMTVGGLKAYTKYEFQILPVCRTTGAATSDSVIRTYTTNPKPPPAVRHLTSHLAGPEWIVVQWLPPSPPRGELERYEVAVRNKTVEPSTYTVYPGRNDVKCTGLASDFLCYKVTGLTPATLYKIQVSAKNFNTFFGNKTEIEGRTTEKAPEKVENLTSALNGAEVEIKWEVPKVTNGNITKYTVKYQHVKWEACDDDSISDKNSTDTMEVISTEAVIDLSKLLPFSTYHVTVSAFTVAEGPDETTSFVTPQVAPSDSVKNVTWQESEEASVEVSWSAPSCDKIGCDLKSYLVNVNDVINSTDYQSIVITSIKPYTEYKINIIPECDSRIPRTSNIFTEIQFKSKPKPPPPVKTITIHDQGTTWLMVKWAPPNPPNGELENYKIEVLEEGSDIKVGTVGQHSPCPEQNEMTCVRIDNLKPGKKYKIKVDAKNKNTLLFVQGTQKEFQTPKDITLLATLSSLGVLVLIAILVLVLVLRRRCQTLRVGDKQKLHINPTTRGAEMLPLELDTMPLAELSEPRQEFHDTPAVDPEVLSYAGAGQKLSKPVKLAELGQYVETGLSSGEFKRQHGMFPRGQTQPWDYGRLPENKNKNRYGNLVAYDATRVKLEPLSGVPFSDYINANYLDGYRSPRAYIATQGPRSNTLVDFWRMVWQENVHLIVMLANVVENGKPKCEKYWPEVNSKVIYGDVTIQTTAQQIYADFTYRDIELFCNGAKRKVLQMHFTSWPDHGVPMYPQTVAAFLKKILLTRVSGPILVHCSAGVGRTGCIILADACLRMAAIEGEVDPLGLMQNIRAQRPNMVDNFMQFEFVHVVLEECLLRDKFNIECSQYHAKLQQLLADQRALLEQQFSRVNDLCRKDVLRKNCDYDFSWPRGKSRFPNIAPGSEGRVLLHRQLGGSDYINAVYVDGFRAKSQFIATQLPLPDTVGDFWLMVEQTGAGLVLVLNQPDPGRDQTTCVFWPEEDSELVLSGSSTLTLKHQSDSRLFEFRHVEVQSEIMMQGEVDITEHNVHVISVKGWPGGQLVPSDPSMLIELWEEAERKYENKGPIVVMCHDGATGCGLLLAVSFVVEKMKLEHEVDVALAVRTIRNARGHFVTSLDQFEYVHQAALSYLETFETYANFQ